MIFKPWSHRQFEEAGFAQIGATAMWERRGVPLYTSSQNIREIWIPSWAVDFFHGVELADNRRFSSGLDENFARVSAAAIRSDDPDAFVEAVLAAYALGGWSAALQLADAQAQDTLHAEGPT